MTTAQSILNAAAGHMQARAATYDKPGRADTVSGDLFCEAAHG